MKILFVFLIAFSPVFAATQAWVSVEVKVKSHHGTDETMNLKIMKEGKTVKLIVDDFILPETRILTNKKDLDTIVNFAGNAKEEPCGMDKYIYVKKVKGKDTQFSGCPTSENFQALRKSFQNISAIKQ